MTELSGPGPGYWVTLSAILISRAGCMPGQMAGEETGTLQSVLPWWECEQRENDGPRINISQYKPDGFTQTCLALMTRPNGINTCWYDGSLRQVEWTKFLVYYATQASEEVLTRNGMRMTIETRWQYTYRDLKWKWTVWFLYMVILSAIWECSTVLTSKIPKIFTLILASLP